MDGGEHPDTPRIEFGLHPQCRSLCRNTEGDEGNDPRRHFQEIKEVGPPLVDVVGGDRLVLGAGAHVPGDRVPVESVGA